MERNFSPWAYWRARLDELPSRPAPPLRDDVAAWRTAATATLSEVLGPWPEAVPLRLETTDEHRDDGLVVRRVVFDSERHMSVPAIVLAPNGRRAPGPAVVALHGHGLDKEDLCGTRPGGDGVDYARQLARRGAVVLAPDLRTFGERADDMIRPPADPDLETSIAHHQFSCGFEMVCATVHGVVPLTLNLWDVRRCIDVLAEDPSVDGRRIGVAGWSYGGALSLLAAAVDPRVAAALVSCFVSSWRAAHTVPWNLCGSQIGPGLIERLDHLEVAALVAPRALVVENGRTDVLVPFDDACATMQGLGRVYDAVGAGDRLTFHPFDGGHRWDGSGSLDSFATALGMSGDGRAGRGSAY